MKVFLSALLTLLVLSSCSVMGIKKHEPGFKNVRELEAVKGSYKVVDVSATTEKLRERLKTSSLSCRLTTFNMPANKTVADYLRDALTDEFDAARKLSPEGTPVSVNVNGLESSSGSFSKGNWQLDFDYVVKGKNYNVKTTTEFESAYMADTACRNTAEALSAAISDNFAAFYRQLPRESGKR